MMLRNLMIVLVLFTLIGCSNSQTDRKDEEDKDIAEETLRFTFEMNEGIDTVTVFTNHFDTGAYAVRNNRPIEVVVIKNNVNLQKPGSYEIVYESSYGGQTAWLTRDVHVLPKRSITIDIKPGVDTVYVGTEWIDAGAVSFDAQNNQIPYTTHGQVDTSREGVYEIVYRAESDGNAEEKIRYVFVINKGQ